MNKVYIIIYLNNDNDNNDENDNDYDNDNNNKPHSLSYLGAWSYILETLSWFWKIGALNSAWSTEVYS